MSGFDGRRGRSIELMSDASCRNGAEASMSLSESGHVPGPACPVIDVL